MNKWSFLLKMRKEYNGQCKEKNKKLYKVKRAGKSDYIPFTDRIEYYIS